MRTASRGPRVLPKTSDRMVRQGNSLYSHHINTLGKIDRKDLYVQITLAITMMRENSCIYSGRKQAKNTLSLKGKGKSSCPQFFLSIMLTLWDKWSQSYRVLRENMAVSQDATKIYCQAQEK